MKKQWTIGLVFTLLMSAAAPMLAQTQPNVPVEGRRNREIPSPESNARRIVGEFKKTFHLTEKEYDKVYELYLKQEKSLMPEQGAGFRGGMPPRGGFGGPGGGFGGPGGGFGGPGGGFGGPGGGFGGPSEGMGMPSQGDFQPRGDRQMPEEMKAMMEERRKEQEKKQEKAFNTLKKKMKKILEGEEYARWKQWEKDRKSKPRKP